MLTLNRRGWRKPRFTDLEKLIFQSEHDALLEACEGMMTTLVDQDVRVKSAASDVFPRSKLAEFKPPKGKFMIHAVAMGADEFFGPNKNWDGFSMKDLMAKHATFVTHGHMFREHVNRDPKKAIGQIKASAYHPTLHRVELILWGDREKAAKEYEALKSGKGLDFSMSCRLRHDVDNCCGHKAKSASEYCVHLRKHIGKYLPEFEKYAYALNPDPTFFDMSAVGNRADRIARFLQFDLGEEMRKAASSGGFIYSEDWAKLAGVNLPKVPDKLVPMSSSRKALLRKLAAVEQEFEDLIRSGEQPSDWMSQFRLKVACRAFDRDITLSKEDLAPARNLRPGTFFRELAKRAAVLSPDVLWAYVEGEDPSSLDKSARSAYVRTFRDLLEEVEKTGGCGGLTDLCDIGTRLSSDTDPEYSDEVDELMEKADEKFGVSPGPVEGRTMLKITIIKAASLPDSVSDLSGEQAMLRSLYGCYKTAAAEAILALRPDIDEDSLLSLLVGQNFQFASA